MTVWGTTIQCSASVEVSIFYIIHFLGGVCRVFIQNKEDTCTLLLYTTIMDEYSFSSTGRFFKGRSEFCELCLFCVIVDVVLGVESSAKVLSNNWK